VLERLADPLRRASVRDYFTTVSKLPDCGLLAVPWYKSEKARRMGDDLYWNHACA